jgi:hypothetical protein
LFVEVEVCERKLNSFPNLLFLHVEAANLGIGNIRLLMIAKHRDRGVGLWRQNIHKGVGVAVKRDGGGGLELLAVER